MVLFIIPLFDEKGKKSFYVCVNKFLIDFKLFDVRIIDITKKLYS